MCVCNSKNHTFITDSSHMVIGWFIPQEIMITDTVYGCSYNKKYMTKIIDRLCGGEINRTTLIEYGKPLIFNALLIF